MELDRSLILSFDVKTLIIVGEYIKGCLLGEILKDD